MRRDTDVAGESGVLEVVVCQYHEEAEAAGGGIRSRVPNLTCAKA
jgi:hypothetical protein